MLCAAFFNFISLMPCYMNPMLLLFRAIMGMHTLSVVVYGTSCKVRLLFNSVIDVFFRACLSSFDEIYCIEYRINSKKNNDKASKKLIITS